jgi:hypothetical protein
MFGFETQFSIFNILSYFPNDSLIFYAIKTVAIPSLLGDAKSRPTGPKRALSLILMWLCKLIIELDFSLIF